MKLSNVFSPEMLHRIENIVFIILSVLPVAIALSFIPGFMGDDTYIHIGFAKGLLETGKFTFANNETYGTTSPLWVILTSLLTLITNNPELSIRLLSGLFTISTILLFNHALRIIGIDSKPRIILTISLVLNPFFIKWSISGMEASASMSFLLICIIYLFRSKNISSNYFGTFLGLAFLLRPEFLVVFVFTLIFFLKEKKSLKFILSFLTQFIIIVTAWIIYALIHFGTIIPNTFRAKAKDSFFSVEFEKLIRNVKVLLTGNLPEFAIVALIMIILIYIKLTNKDSIKNFFRRLFRFKSNPELILTLLWAAGFYFFYILKNVTILSRYSLMFVPVIILLTAELLNNLKLLVSEKFYRFVVLSYLMLILIINNFILFNTVVPSSNNFVSGFQKTFKEISEIINSDDTVKNKSVALTDVGIVGTFTNAKVYDLAGLVDEDRFNYPEYAGYVLAKRPNYIVLREEAEITEVIPSDISYQILYQRKIPGFGINTPEPRTVTLYKIFW